MAATVDVWTVMLGAVILGITNKVIEYYWETHGKSRLRKFDQMIFKHNIEEQMKQNAVHKNLSRRVSTLQKQIDDLKKRC